MPIDPRRRLAAFLRHPQIGSALRMVLGLVAGVAFTLLLLDNIDFDDVRAIIGQAA